MKFKAATNKTIYYKITSQRLTSFRDKEQSSVIHELSDLKTHNSHMIGKFK